MPARMSVDQSSLRFTIVNVGNAAVNMKRAEMAAVNAAGRFLLEQVRQTLSYEDHTLDDLAGLDHPYARRHGGIQLSHNTRGGMLRDGTHGVHRQSGRLLKGLIGRPNGVGPGGGHQYTIEVHRGIAPHFRYITQGTRTMLPRDPLWETALGPAMVRALRKEIIRVLGKELRSQALIRFRPVGKRL